MIDLTNERPIPLEDACRIIPPARGGRRCHLSTILRWILTGSKAPNGRRVRLEALRLGGRWMTSAAALQRFADALTPRPSGDAARTFPRTPRQADAAAERAGAELRRDGA
jgi:hypothetical protein